MCVVCERPFTWRKKWERCWDEVTTCSKSCNSKRRSGNRAVLEEDENGDDGEDDDNKDKGGRSLSMERKPSKNNIAKKEKQMHNSEVAQKVLTSSQFDAAEPTNEYLDQDEIFGMTDELDMLTLEELFDEANSNPDADDDDGEINVSIMDQVAREKAAGKAAKKVKKAERRAQRQGHGDPMAGQKACDMCSKSVNLLVRCTYDESLQWKMVCGTCWKDASGGVVDGDSSHPFYRYGGLWKNRRAQV